MAIHTAGNVAGLGILALNDPPQRSANDHAVRPEIRILAVGQKGEHADSADPLPVAAGPGSVILDQVTNGVAIRMALLYLVMGGEKNSNDGS